MASTENLENRDMTITITVCIRCCLNGLRQLRR